MTSEDLAPVADEEPVSENQEKSICVKNSSAAAEAETLTVTYGKTSDETSLLGQKSQNINDVAVEVEGDPVPLILVPVKEPAVPDHEATDDIGVPSKDLAYDEAILNKGEESGSGNSGLIATGITLESVLKADVSEPLNEVKSSESVLDVCSPQKAKGLDFDLNEDVHDEEVDSLKSVSVEERGHMSEETQYLFGMNFYIKSSGVPKHELDLNKMPTNEDSHDLFPDTRDPMQPTYVSNEQQPEFPLWCMPVDDDLHSLYGWINPHYHTQQGYVSYEQQHPAYPTWSSALVFPYTDVDDDSQLSYFHPIYVSDDEEPAFPKWASLLNNSPLGVDSISIISCTPNGAEPAKGRFNPNTSFMMPEDDSVESKSGEWDLKLFGQSIPVSEGPILKTGMKRKDIDCTLQLCSSDYKRYRLTL